MKGEKQSPVTDIRFFNKKEKPDIASLQNKYKQVLAGFSKENRPKKEIVIKDIFNTLSERLGSQEDFVFGEFQKAILQLKLARHFQHNESIDSNTLFDAVIESPRFLNREKGPLYHLLEVHQQKTLLKIAEIRKNRAEMTSQEVEEKINPYEALFTTKSGNYYLARLLNMPHLQEESEYMKNCVGTSDSYINRMKKGETEIFSLRGLKDDKPVLTIEYDIKKGSIEQIKKEGDNYLTTDDPLLKDVIDALKQLRETKNDIGKPRKINKINPAEFQNFRVKAEYLLTDHGEIHFTNLNPEENPFILKAGIMLLTGITRAEAAKLLRIFEHLEFNPDQIARQPNEINKNTKAYVGKLEPGIFEKILQYNVEHIYTSFPEGRVLIEKDFEVGPISFEEFERKIEQYNKSVADGSQKIKISDHAKYMMLSKNFATLKNVERMSFVRLKVRDLENIYSPTKYEGISDNAEKLGLKLCPPEAAPLLRLHYINQPLGEWIGIGTKTIVDDSGNPRIFDMGRNEIEMWFGGEIARSIWHPNYEFVFRLPK